MVLAISTMLMISSCSKQEEISPNNSVGVRAPAPSNVIGELSGTGSSNTYRTGSVLQLSWDTGTFGTVGIPPGAAYSATLEFQLNGATVLKAVNVPITYRNNAYNNLQGYIDYDLPVMMGRGTFHLIITGNGSTHYINGVSYSTLQGDVTLALYGVEVGSGVIVSGGQSVTTSFQLNWDHTLFGPNDYVRFYAQATLFSSPVGPLIDLGVYPSTYMSADGRGAFSNAVSGPQTAVLSYTLPSGDYNIVVGNVNDGSYKYSGAPNAVASNTYETGGTITVR
jgi:hypothetical protein